MIGLEVTIGNKEFRMPTQDSKAWIVVNYRNGKAIADVGRIPVRSKCMEQWIVGERIGLNQTIRIRYGELGSVATPPVTVRVNDNMPERPLLSRLEFFKSFEKWLKEEGILKEY